MTEPTAVLNLAAAALPARTLRAATPYLEAPFDPATIGMFVRRKRKDRDSARVVFFVPIEEVEARLNHVAGPGRWSRGASSVLDGRSLSCELQLLGAAHVAVGQGADPATQSVNGLKRCALHFGVGRYLRSLAPLEVPIGTGPEQVPTGPDGDPVLTPALAIRAREHYARELARLEHRFGPALIHPQRPWNRRPDGTVSLGRRRGLAALAARALAAGDHADASTAAIAAVGRVLLAVSPRSLRERVAARERVATASTVAGRSRAARPLSVIDGQPATEPTIAVDFAALGPDPTRRAA